MLQAHVEPCGSSVRLLTGSPQLDRSSQALRSPPKRLGGGFDVRCILESRKNPRSLTDVCPRLAIDRMRQPHVQYAIVRPTPAWRTG